MTDHKYFFDIPIFRCTQEKFWAEFNEDRQKLIKFFKNASEYNTEADCEKMAETSLARSKSHYFYNEMVGMIRLFAINLQIRGELWFIKEGPRKGLKNKSWYLANSKIFENWINGRDTNQGIFDWIITKLKEENTEGMLKGRHIDFEAFLNAGKNINYLALSNAK